MTEKEIRLESLRHKIQVERRYVDKKPYSHNIISINLRMIAEEFGYEESNKAIDDFKLNRLGWSKVEIGEGK